MFTKPNQADHVIISTSGGKNYWITTSDADTDAGYPEVSIYLDSMDEIKSIAPLGVPYYRLSVFSKHLDDDGYEQWECIGDLEDFKEAQ